MSPDPNFYPPNNRRNNADTCRIVPSLLREVKSIVKEGGEETRRDDERKDDGRAEARERADRITRSFSGLDQIPDGN